MSETVSGYVVLGVRIDEKDFWKVVGRKRQCTSCRRPCETRYCGNCGSSRIYQVDVREPTERLLRWAGSKEHVERFWDPEGNFEHKDDVAIYRATHFVPSSTPFFVLGVRILDAGFDNGARAQVASCDLDELRLAQERVKLALRSLLLPAVNPSIYLSVYYS